MKTLSFIAALFIMIPAFAQLEISSGVAVNKQNAVGFPIHLGYEIQLSKRLYTKSAAGYKYMHRYNDYAGATLNVSTWEFHQTIAYEVIKKKNYILKPNAGVNYRFYHWKGKMDPPYNTIPQRAWVIGVRGENFTLNSYDNGYEKDYRISNWGFTIQLQNQFRITDNVWLHVTPFLEPDYDQSQSIGGAYVGVILKSL